MNSAELYDPAAPLATARYLHTAALLPSGQALVVGGLDSGQLSSAELYNPTSNTWSPATSRHTARNLHTATLLPSGQGADCRGQQRQRQSQHYSTL